jgi:hypothetical protein
MISAAVFVAVFAALLVARIVFATIVFLWVLPEGKECPICDAPTLRLRSAFWNVLFPRFRTSWCPECGWEGLLRGGGVRATPGRTVSVPLVTRPRTPRVARRAE